MNVITLMPPLSLIKHLKMYLQATFVFFCAKLYNFVIDSQHAMIGHDYQSNYTMIGNLFVLLYLLYCFKYTF